MRSKVLKGVAVLGLIGGLAFTAFAEAPQGKSENPGAYSGPCSMCGMMGPGMGMRGGALTGVPNEKLQKFYQETKALRQKLWETREALRELHLSPNPDWKAIAEKRAEMARLMTELQEKASKEGVPFAYGRGYGMGMGYGKGFGKGACG